MRVTVEGSSFGAAVRAAAAAAPARPTFVAHAALRLRATTDLTVAGTDGTTTVTARLEAAAPVTSGEVVVPVGPLAAWARTGLPSGPLTVTVVAGGAEVEVTAHGLAPYRFRTLQVTFPNPPDYETMPRPFDPRHLAAALRAVKPCAGPERVVGLRARDDGTLAVFATDGYRLARAVIADAARFAATGVVPLAALELTARLGAERLGVDVARRVMVAQRAPHTTVVSRLSGVELPDVHAIADAPPPARARLARAALDEALTRLTAATGPVPVRLTGTGDGLRLTAANVERGAGAEAVAAAGDTTGLGVLVDSAFLADAVGAHPDAELILAWGGPATPLHLVSDAAPAVTSVVMPMRGR